MDIKSQSAISNKNTWDSYLSDKNHSYLSSGLKKKSVIGDYIANLNLETANAFELGCGGSVELLKLADRGWNIGGIDYHQDSVELLKDFCDKSKYAHDFYSGDILNFDLDKIEKKSLLLSFGLLEHFENPSAILSRWSEILKPGGLVVSSIPNLTSVNAKLLAKFDPELWNQHIVSTPKALDSFHQQAGLEIVKAANYVGCFDEFCLIPWLKIRQQTGGVLFKFLKYSSSLVVSPVLKTVTSLSPSMLSPYIIGVYRKH